MLPRWTVVALCLAATLGGAAPASAATLEVPGDFPKIQLAVDAADPGDVIAVKKKLNKENVVVNTERLTIRGVGKEVTVDALAGGDGFAFDINSDGVAVRNMLIKHGAGIDCTADRCGLTSLRFGGASNTDCINISGNRALLADSRLVACGDAAVEVIGTRARILGNSMRLIDAACVAVVGDRAVIRGNVVGRCEDGEAITYFGNDATIAGNNLHNTDADVMRLVGDHLEVVGNTAANGQNACLDLDGAVALVKRNRGRACREGLEITGTTPRVISNRMVDTISEANGAAIEVDCIVVCDEGTVRGNLAADISNDSDGIAVDVPAGTGSFEVAGNVARNNAQNGFLLSIPDGVVRDNLAVGNGFEHEDGFSIFGPGARIVGNTALGNGGFGFNLAGGVGGMKVVKNLARGNHLDGLLVSGTAPVLTENVARNNFGDGIENGGTNTELRRNVAGGNQVDCANNPLGTIAVKQGNRCADGSNFNVPGEV